MVCNGNVRVSLPGDFMNNGAYTSSEERIYLSGTSKQQIGGTGSNSFFGMELNNPLGAFFTSDITITNELNLSNGILDLVDANLTLGASLTAVEGPLSLTNMVIASGAGEIRKRYTATPLSGNSDAFLFPLGTIGDQSEYSPVIMNFESANFGPQAYVSVQTINEKNPELGPEITSFIQRYWVVEPNDITDYNYEIKLYYTDDDVVTDGSVVEGDLVPVKYSNENWYIPQGASTGLPEVIEQGSSFSFASSNYMVWGGLTSFSQFGSVGGSFQPLPVELIAFQGECLDGLVTLNWSTASEFNSAYFDVEKSVNGIDWQIINSQIAALNSSSQIEYYFFDPNKSFGDVYYRLNQVDIDGASEYFGPVHLTCEDQNRVMMTFPNPSSGNFNVGIMDDRFIGDVNVKVADASGKVVGEKDCVLISGMNIVPCAGDILESGVYCIYITSDHHVEIVKHIISD